MAIFKCKMCGGNLEVNEKSTVGTCQYCGSTMTLPKDSDEKKANLFNRANHYRRNNDFDKAMATYENILNEDNNYAEAHWGVVLCKYGIEYVEDPKTKKRIPTCHRAQFGSILADEDYKQALANADEQARLIYEQEAKAIEGIQKQILEISAKEEPFDVFICYKETSETGSRTKDSVIAQDIYYHLTEAGYKVFFSRITLEDKLGTAYEPYIFAALNSSKVMVVVGTKPEHFNATWTKNEWSRYLTLIKGGARKILIPAYKDMDPYDLPEEFSHLQAQDMSKIGFVQDLTRGIKKVVSEKEQPAAAASAAGSVPASNVNALLDRAFMALEDGEFEKAEEMLEQVLNNDSRNAQAYIGKLMAEKQVRFQKDLSELAKPFSDSKNFEKAMRFATPETSAKLVNQSQSIVDRNQELKNESIYTEAKKWLFDGEYNYAIEAFNNLGDYKDGPSLLIEAKEKKYDFAHSQVADNNYDFAIKAFSELGNYRDSLAKADEVIQMNIQMKNEIIYKQLCQDIEQLLLDRSSYPRIFELINYRQILLKLGDYSDSTELVFKIDDLRKKEEIYNSCVETILKSSQLSELDKANKELISIGDYRNSAGLLVEVQNKIVTIQRKEKGLKKLKFAIPTIIVLILAYAFILYPFLKYNQAKGFLEQQKYEAASALFYSLGSYHDSEEQRNKIFPIIIDKYSKTQRKSIAAGEKFTIGLKSDGTLVAVGDNSSGQLDVAEWKGIVAITAGSNHTIGLKADGSVVAVGYNLGGQKDVADWRGIVAIAAGANHTVGLKSDGTVIAVGNNNVGQLNVEDWRGISAIAAGANHTVGLKSDGTVVAVGNNNVGQLNVEDWGGIIAIAAGSGHTIGLKSDGSVLAVGNNKEGQLNVEDWREIIAIAAGSSHTIGLKSDGSVLAVGNNKEGQLNVEDWREIITIAAGAYHTIGLKAEGTVIAIGYKPSGQIDVEDWNKISLSHFPEGSSIK